ncbi:TPA: hypothetical protein ACKP7D_000972 [Serratia marcescens]
MNFTSFMNTLTKMDVSSKIIESVTTKDTLGRVLRLQLVAEQLVESWVCGATNSESIFGTNDTRVLIEASKKIEIANNLNLPIEISNILKKLNKLRNDFAHNHSINGIPDNIIASMEANLANRLGGNMVSLKNTYIDVDYNGDGNISRIVYSDNETTNDSKLSIITLCAMRLLIESAQSIAK